MSEGKKGCLAGLLRLPSAIAGSLRRSPALIGTTVRVAAVDRGDWRLARDSADRSLRMLSKSDAPAPVRTDLENALRSLVSVVDELAERLSDAREYLAKNDVQRLAKERTDIEMRALDTSFDVQRAALSELASVDARLARSADMARERDALEARLRMGCARIRALEAEVHRAASLGEAAVAPLLGDLRGHEAQAREALKHWEATAREVLAAERKG